MFSKQDNPEIASRLAGILDLPPRRVSSIEPLDSHTIDQIIEDGLPTASLNALQVYLDALNLDCSLQPLGAVSDHRSDAKGRLSREQGRYVVNIACALAKVERTFHGDEVRIGRFLQRPHALLDGRAPIEHLCSSTTGSATDISDILHRAAAGVPV